MKDLIITSKEELESLIERSIERALEKTSTNACNDSQVDLLTRQDLADLFEVSLVTISKWTKAGLLPPKIKRGGRVYYQKIQVMEMLNSKEHGHG